MLPPEIWSKLDVIKTGSAAVYHRLGLYVYQCIHSETATAISAAELLTVRKDDLIDLLRQWPEVMAELTTEAEKHFEEVKVRQQHFLPTVVAA